MKNINKLILPLTFIISCTMSFSANARLNSPLVARNAVFDGVLQSKLKSILSPQDFNNFNSNLDEFSASYTLKSGATYYEATRNGLNAASALVVSPGGYYYVAYKLPNNNQIVYITNDNNCTEEPHDAIKVFSHAFVDKPTIISSKSTSVNTGSHSCNGVYGKIKKANYRFITSSITTDRKKIKVKKNKGKKMAKKAAVSIWGASVANKWNMNDELAAVVGEAINQIRKCSDSSRLVPRPPFYGTKPWRVYFALYGTRVIDYNVRLRNHKYYRTCIFSTAGNLRNRAENASRGI